MSTPDTLSRKQVLLLIKWARVERDPYAVGLEIVQMEEGSFARLVATALAVMEERAGLYDLCRKSTDRIAQLEAENAALLTRIAEDCEHAAFCNVTLWRRRDQPDPKPECDCGLTALLSSPARAPDVSDVWVRDKVQEVLSYANDLTRPGDPSAHASRWNDFKNALSAFVDELRQPVPQSATLRPSPDYKVDRCQCNKGDPIMHTHYADEPPHRCARCGCQAWTAATDIEAWAGTRK